ncbi:hypothetical protein SAMD00023353_3200850 [Rosellinia necatrix]|uniref:Uncharacterized protein n=1 Tax=Rosellinia necatrix TaxID=77044 RepID=A0A1S8A9S4_ROSNE|nr:hypothetical protein SAMD00023353_3200850 [Rosellinia necatrix]
MIPPPPLHRHQSSPKSAIKFPTEPPEETDQRSAAKDGLNRIIDYFNNNPYNRSQLVRCTY